MVMPPRFDRQVRMSRALLRFGDGRCSVRHSEEDDEEVAVAVQVEPSRAGERGSSSTDTPGTGGSPALAVGVVVVPPPVRRGLRVPLRRVLPLLLAAERGDVEVVPGVPHLLVAAGGDEVGAEDLVVLAEKRIGAVPLVDVEVLIEVVGDRVPGDVLPSVALLQALDLGL